ncbi:MAG: tetratricopeptide repeat protein [Planctomycetota bacterium]
MAARVNTTFVLALAGVLVLLVGAVVAAYVVIESRSADRYITLAGQAEENGDLRRAVSYLGRAARKQPDNVEVRDQLLEIIPRVQVQTRPAAQDYLRDYMAGRREVANLLDYPDDRLEDYFGTLYGFYTRFGDPSFLSEITREAGNRIASNPNTTIARKYRGMATVALLGRDTPADERDRAAEDLQLAVAALPQDTDAAFALTRWYLREADRIDQPGDNAGDRPEEAGQLRDTALTLAKDMLAVDPDDPLRKMRYVQLLLDPAFNPDSDIPHPNTQLAIPVTDQIVANASAAADAEMTVFLAVVNQMPGIYRQDTKENPDPQAAIPGLKKAQEAVARAGEDKPPQPPLLFALADIEKRLERPQEAIALYQRVVEASDTGNFVTFLEGRNYAARALYGHADLLIAQLESGGREAMQERIAKVESIADELAGRRGEEDPFVDIIRGKALMLSGQHAQAIFHIDRASQRANDSNLELLMISAKARELAGQPGAAAQRYERVMSLRPGVPAIQIEYARLLIEMGRADEARPLLEPIVATDPDNAIAKRLLAAATLREPGGNVEAAIATLRQQAENGGLSDKLALASGLAQAKQNDEAHQIALEALEIAPADIRALRLAVTTTEDVDTRRRLINRAADAGLESTQADLMLQAVETAASDSPEAREQLVNNFIAQRTDPVEAKLLEARLFIDNEDPELAARGQAALNELIETAPDNAAVVNYRLIRAIQQEDFQLAESLVSQAERLDIDLAGGLFLRTTLLEAQGEPERALITLRSALERRPVFSQGWMRMGKLQTELGDLDAAVEAYQTSVEQDPTNVRAQTLLAQTRLALGQPEQALTAIRSAARQQPNNDALQKTAMALEQEYGDADAALAARRQWAERFPDDLTNLRQMALALAQRGEGEEAMEVFERSITDEDEPLKLIQFRAALYAESGDPERGLDTIVGYLRAKGDNATAEDYLVLAQFFLDNQRPSQAAAALQRARQLEDKELMPASRTLGDLLFNRGLNEQAALLYEEVLTASPDDQSVRLRLAETYLRLQQIEDAKRVVDSGEIGESDTAKLVRALIARQDGDVTTAMRLINQMITADPRRADLYIHRAVTLAMQDGRMTAAMTDVNRALSLDPDSVFGRITLVRLHRQQGDQASVISELQRLVARAPEYAAGHRMLANELASMGRANDAELVLMTAAQQFENDPSWPRQIGQIAQRRGDAESAIAAFRSALQISRDPEDQRRLVDALLVNRQPQQALAALSIETGLDTSLPSIQAAQAQAFMQLGRTQEGKDTFDRALEKVEDADTLIGVARRMGAVMPSDEVLATLEAASDERRRLHFEIALSMLTLGDDAQAAHDRLQAIADAAQADETTAIPWTRTMALAAYSIGDFTAAREAYQTLVDANAADATVLNNYAFMLIADLDDAQTGLEMAKRAAAQMPDNAKILDTVGLAELKLDLVDDAITTLETSVQRESLAINNLHLGMAYSRVGRNADAAEAFNRAIQIGRDAGPSEADAAERAATLIQELQNTP